MLAGIYASPKLEPLLEIGYRSLDGVNGGDPAVHQAVDLFWGLRQDLYRSDRRAEAVERLFVLWSDDPNNVMWPELAVRERRFTGSRKRREERFLDPTCADTSTAVGTYLHGWRQQSVSAYVSQFRLAQRRLEGDATFPAFWIGLNVAIFERIGGDIDRAIEVAIDLLPAARDLGGWRLEALVWKEIAYAMKVRGELDDALHAIVLADALATAALPPGGPVAGLLRIRELRADILADRRDVTAAMDLYKANSELAMSLDLAYLASRNLNHQGLLAEGIGRRDLLLPLFQRGLRITLADDDSLNVPRHLMNIAYCFRMQGELDSCLTYQKRAARWVDAYPARTNVARMPLMQAEYYAQIGDYAVVDSLLTAAASMSSNESTFAAKAELHLELIRGWMEVGRPDLIYRSIAAIEDLRHGVGDVAADRHVAADLNLLIGEFLTRRGEYVLAAEALDMADAALKTRASPKRAWTLAKNRGLLARERGQLNTAEAAFRKCIALGIEQETPENESTGRLLLGSVLLAGGRFSEARHAFPATDDEQFVGRFMTRVSAILLTGISYAREGDYDLALRALEDARSVCRSWSPLELTGRIDLEMGLVLASAGRVDEAARLFGSVAASLENEAGLQDLPELAQFTGDLRRDLVEAMVALPGSDPNQTLQFARRILPAWHGSAPDPDRRLATPQIIFLVGSRVTARWIVGGDGVSCRLLPGAAELNRLLAPVLADMGTPGRDGVAADVIRLSHVLLDGVIAHWPAGETLVIVPDLELYGVPWAALPIAGPRNTVLDRGPVTIVDAPLSNPISRARADRERRLLAIGTDSESSGRMMGLAALRHAEREAREVASVWPTDRSVLSLGENASLALTANEELNSYAVVHVASHARVYGGRAGQAILLLAGADDDPLTARNIRTLALDADLVFLSCCEAADGHGQRAGQAGLARSFLDAGARYVVGPGIAIDDEAARQLATRFYSHLLSGLSVPGALRAAQMDLRDGDPRWSHAFYWGFYQASTRGGAVESP